jgi:hypothetical protein
LGGSGHERARPARTRVSRVAFLVFLGLAVGAAPLRAARPVTDGEFARIKAAAPAAIKKVLPKALPSCFEVRRQAARRSTSDKRYLSASFKWRARCGEDASYGFQAVWRFAPKGLRLVFFRNQSYPCSSATLALAAVLPDLGACEGPAAARILAAYPGLGAELLAATGAKPEEAKVEQIFYASHAGQEWAYAGFRFLPTQIGAGISFTREPGGAWQSLGDAFPPCALPLEVRIAEAISRGRSAQLDEC